MDRINTYYLYLFILILTGNLSFSQTDSIDIYDLDFKQLSKLKITSASKTPQYINEIPSTIFIITSTEIKEKGYFTLEEALSDLPGFQFRNTLGYNGYVFQRGIPNQNNLILVLIDGVQVNELNSGGFYGGAQYNLSNVERIEVVYGPKSVTYGTNAVSGIINIITKSAVEPKLEINALLGSFSTTEADVNYCYSNKGQDVGIRFSGMIKKSDKADLKGEEGDSNWTDLMDNYEDDYAFDLKIQVKDFILGTNYLHKKSATVTSVKSIGTVFRDYGTLWNIRFINNYLSYNKSLSKHLSLSSALYNRNATVLDNTVNYVVDTAQIGYYRPNNLTGMENIVSYKIGKVFSLSGGITAEYEQLAKQFSITYSSSPDIKPPKPERPAMDKNTLISIFLEPRLTILQSLFLSGGIRFDQSSFYDQVLTPQCGLSYNFYNQIVRLSYSQAFRAPRHWDYTDGLGNNSLLPEKMESLEAAITFSISNNYKIDLIGYKNILENALTKQIVNENYRWINEGKVKTDGIEIHFRYASRWLKLAMNYTFNQSYNARDEFVPEISKHCANASATCSLTDHLKINLRANYVGKRENLQLITATQSMDVDPFLIFNASVSLLEYRGLNIQFTVKNILDAEYYHTSNRPPERYRQPQQTILFSVGSIIKPQN